MKLTREEQLEIYDEALENKRAFFVDWDLNAEDVAYNIKLILPKLDIDGVSPKQVNGDWIEEVTIEGSTYKFDLESETKAVEIVKITNSHLTKTGQTFVLFDSMDDQYCFILINLNELPDYLEKGFIEV